MIGYIFEISCLSFFDISSVHGGHLTQTLHLTFRQRHMCKCNKKGQFESVEWEHYTVTIPETFWWRINSFTISTTLPLAFYEFHGACFLCRVRILSNSKTRGWFFLKTKKNEYLRIVSFHFMKTKLNVLYFM